MGAIRFGLCCQFQDAPIRFRTAAWIVTAIVAALALTLVVSSVVLPLLGISFGS